MTGLEFALIPQARQEGTFIIVRQRRLSPQKAEIECYYAVVEGHIFQCPTVKSILEHKLESAEIALKEAYKLVIKTSLAQNEIFLSSLLGRLA